MPISVLWSKPALCVYAAILLGLAYWGWHNHVKGLGRAEVLAEQAVEAAKLKDAANKAGIEAVEGMTDANTRDADAVSVAADRLRRVCGEVRNAGTTGQPDATDAEAEKYRTLTDAADDLRACQSALNQCTGLQHWVRSLK